MQTHLNRLRQILCFDFSTRESFPTCISQIPHGAARKKKQHEEESSTFIQRFSGPSKHSRRFVTQISSYHYQEPAL